MKRRSLARSSVLLALLVGWVHSAPADAASSGLAHVRVVAVNPTVVLSSDVAVTVQRQGALTTLQFGRDVAPFAVPENSPFSVKGFFHGGVLLSIPGNRHLEIQQPGSLVAPAVPVPAQADTTAQPPVGWTASYLDGRMATPPSAPSLGNSPRQADFHSVSDTAGDAVAKDAEPVVSSRIYLPVGDKTGVAFFRRGARYEFLADGAHAMDTSALTQGSPFAGLKLGIEPGITRITIPAAGLDDLSVTRVPGGVVLDAHPANPVSAAAFHMVQRPGAVTFLLQTGASRTVRIVDPETGGALLVGLVGGQAGMVGRSRSMMGFDVLPSRLGLVIAARSDRLVLRATPRGFELEGPGAPGLALGRAENGLSAPTGKACSPLLRVENLPPEALREMARRAWQSAAMAPQPARLQWRVRAARDYLAAGDVHQAASIVDVALHDAPEGAGGVGVGALADVTAFLERKLPDRDAFVADTYAESSEGALWQGLAAYRGSGDMERATNLLFEGVPTLACYPSALRQAIQTDVTDALARYGDMERTRRAFADPALNVGPFSKGFLLAREGQSAEALAMFETLQKDRDPILAARARVEVIALKQAAGTFSPADAATALEASLPDARLAGMEADVRARAAADWSAANRWPEALVTLDGLPPDQQDTAPIWSDRLFLVLSGLLGAAPSATPGGVSGIDVATLVEAHVGRVTDTQRRNQIQLALARQFENLDLPARAVGLLEGVLHDGASGGLRTQTMMRLATDELSVGHADRAAGLAAALDADPAVQADPALRTQAGVLAARAAVALGRPDEALSHLGSSAGQEATGLRADILEGQQDWAGASHALGALVARTAPAQGALDTAQQAAIVRLAADLSRANDRQGLADLATRFAARIDDARQKQVFALLTENTVSHGAGEENGVKPAHLVP